MENAIYEYMIIDENVIHCRQVTFCNNCSLSRPTDQRDPYILGLITPGHLQDRPLVWASISDHPPNKDAHFLYLETERREQQRKRRMSSWPGGL